MDVVRARPSGVGVRRLFRRQADIGSVPFWWHSIELGDGEVTPGLNTLPDLKAKLASLELPALTGKSVLDIGAWDGFFSFEAERAGAKRIVALDHYVWSLDLGRQQAYWRGCAERGETPKPYHTMDFWRPDELPGKKGIDVARKKLGSRVETVVSDFMDGDISRFGSFDVVLYLGVLYHMEDPFGALKRLASVTNELAVIETEAIVVRAAPDESLVEFFPGAELNNDVSNWWSPSEAALHGMCRAAGFVDARTIHRGPGYEGDAPVCRYRAVVHATK
jgi:tRNA (mo5U34)-methyltransferase